MERKSQSEIEAKIKEILISELRVEPQSFDGNSGNLTLLGRGIGLDSIEALTLVTAIEKEFGIEVSDAEFNVDLFESIRTLSAFIEGKLS
jgi:acyl carrier protein